MRKIAHKFVALALSAGRAAPALAGTYSTGMIQAEWTEYLCCNVSNLSTAPITVTMTWFDVVCQRHTQTNAQHPVRPCPRARVAAAVLRAGAGSCSPAVASMRSSKVRASAQVIEPHGGSFSTKAVYPATKK
jgi:hypothetical protein